MKNSDEFARRRLALPGKMLAMIVSALLSVALIGLSLAWDWAGPFATGSLLATAWFTAIFAREWRWLRQQDAPPTLAGPKSAAEEADALRGLLDQHRELGRLQGEKIDALERELGKAHARARALEEENRRLSTTIAALTGRAAG